MDTVNATAVPQAGTLLHDAQLVYDYAVRVGRLPDDALPKAIAATNRALAEGQTPEDLPLAAAMNAAVTAIAPVTLLDLRTGASPFDPKYQTAVKRRQYRLCALTVVLASLIAYYSVALHQEEGILRDVQEIQSARMLEKIGTLRKLVQHDDALSKRDSRYDQYQELLHDLKDLEARRRAAFLGVTQLAESSDWPFQQALRSAVHQLVPDRRAGGAGATADKDPPQHTEPQQTPSDFCGSDSAANKLVGGPLPVNWREGLESENNDEYCFLQKLDLGYGAANYVSPFGEVARVRDKIMLQSAWILPFLSGLFGAAVFLLRDALDTRTPVLGATPALVRIAMGGIAGIIIGWFWAPTNLPHTELGAISSVPFGLAFLTGFSIDILFSVLDRLKRSVSDPTTAGSQHRADR